MSITITGIISQQAVESLGRRRVIQFGQLDQMQCVFFGPGAALNNFPINSPHPEYPLMFCTGSEATTIPGNLAEIHANYQGKMLTSGQASYVTYPVTTESPVQGSRDFIDLFITPLGYTGLVYGPGGLGAQWEQMYTVTTRPVTVRYIGRECSVHYQSYPRPNKLVYSHLGLSRVQWSILSETYGASSTVTKAVTSDVAKQVQDINYQQLHDNLPRPTGIPPLYAANLGVNIQQIGMWYDCTEIYGPTF